MIYPSVSSQILLDDQSQPNFILKLVAQYRHVFGWQNIPLISFDVPPSYPDRHGLVGRPISHPKQTLGMGIE